MLSWGLCNGKRRIHAVIAGGEASGAHRWRAPVPPLSLLVWTFRSQWRHAAALRGARRARFGYDPESYSQNFDDGAVADGGRPSSPARLAVA